MNQYLKNLNKIEFVVTDACTGRCRHCSQGDHAASGTRLDPTVAADAVRKITARYDIQTVMAFGGEPLLHPDAVCAIMAAAKDRNVPRRQVITNGYVSTDIEKIRELAKRLAMCGINDLLLSVDAFHQEWIPLDTVKAFAAEVAGQGIPIRLQPAWLVNAEHDNAYNRTTKNILESFSSMGIATGSGNIVFPKGRAREYFSEYFLDYAPSDPYEEDPQDVRCISFDSNGDVLQGNVYECDIMKIIADYDPV